MLAFILTLSFIIGVPSLVAAGCYIFDPPYNVAEKRKNRKVSKIYEKGMILRKMGDDPFVSTEYRYVIDVMENESGVTYLKTITCNEDGDYSDDDLKRTDSDTATRYSSCGWKVYSRKED